MHRPVNAQPLKNIRYGDVFDTYETRAQIPTVALTSSVSIYCLHTTLQKEPMLSCQSEQHTKEEEMVVINS